MSEGIQLRVPVSGGASIAATIDLPASRSVRRYPMVLTCDPYRKDDLGKTRYQELIAALTKAEIAHVRIDIRGTGSSTGERPDREYSDQEVADCLEVIEAMSAQHWCNGKVAMWGISWSANIALRMLVEQPERLDAAVIVHGCSDLGRGGIHLIDGIPHFDRYHLAIELLNVLGPDVARIDDEEFLHRFDTTPWIIEWLVRAEDRSFWEQRSASFDYSRIRTPLMVVGGWLDGYRDTVFDLLEHSSTEVEAIIGPWDHVMPETGGPGDALPWLDHLAEWLDCHLNGGPMNQLDSHVGSLRLRGDGPAPEGMDCVRSGPSRRVHIMVNGSMAADQVSEDELRATRPGSSSCENGGFAKTWASFDQWPIHPSMSLQFVPSVDGSLRWATREVENDTDEGSCRAVVDSPVTTGAEVGHWWGGEKGEQNRWGCLCFETDALSDPVTILGRPVFKTRVFQGTQLFARLVDIDQNDHAKLISGGGAVIGQSDFGTVQTLTMRATSGSIPVGHSIGLWLSSSSWPLAPVPAHERPVVIGVDQYTELDLPAVNLPSLPRPTDWLRDALLNVGRVEIQQGRPPSRELWRGVRGTKDGLWPWGDDSEDENLDGLGSSLGYSVGCDIDGVSAHVQGHATVAVPAAPNVRCTFELSISIHDGLAALTCERKLYCNSELVRSRIWREQFQGGWM